MLFRSAGDARFVLETAEQLGYSCSLGRADPLTPHTEDAARIARYRFLRETARATGFRVIALAHTQDDQVETLLLHLLRGSGAHGLSAMRPRSEDLARPLLSTTRDEVEAYLRARNLQARRDSSNDDPRFTRNRLRQTVLPALDAFHPAARRLLARTADLLAEEDGFLNAEAARLDGLHLLSDRAAWRQHPLPLQRRLLRRLFPELSFAQVESLRTLLTDGATGQTRHLPDGRMVLITHSAAEIHPTPSPGARLFALPRLQVRSCECDPTTFHARDPVAHLDADTIRSPLSVSTRAPGDRVQPLGFPQFKKLQDLLVDAHVPRFQRDRLPIVRDQEGIVWISGVTVAHAKRVTAQTRHQLHLELIAD